MEELHIIILGILAGTTTRVLLLRTDYRNYPSSPNGVLIHLAVGFIAAALGSVAVPALLTKNFVAVTFLALAIQQLRDVRRAEKESLESLEGTELVPRGNAYIDGLAKGFESRNYVALFVALGTTIAARSTPGGPWIQAVSGVVIAILLLFLIGKYTGHQTVGQIASIALGEIRFEEADLYVNDVFVRNIGLKSQRDVLAASGIGIVLTPKNRAAGITLANFGLRQAIIHEVSRLLGVKRFYGTRRDFQTGKIVLYFVPMESDPQTALRVVESVPLIESVRRKKAVKLPGQAGV